MYSFTSPRAVLIPTLTSTLHCLSQLSSSLYLTSAFASAIWSSPKAYILVRAWQYISPPDCLSLSLFPFSHCFPVISFRSISGAQIGDGLLFKK